MHALSASDIFCTLFWLQASEPWRLQFDCLCYFCVCALFLTDSSMSIPKHTVISSLNSLSKTYYRHFFGQTCMFASRLWEKVYTVGRLQCQGLSVCFFLWKYCMFVNKMYQQMLEGWLLSYSVSLLAFFTLFTFSCSNWNQNALR